MGVTGNVKADFSGIKKFAADLNCAAKAAEIELFYVKCTKELAARLLAKVIRRTHPGEKPKLTEPKTVKVEGASGKKRSFLSAEAARVEKYWSGYQGGTLRRGWTAKTEAEAESGGSGNAVAYAQSLQVEKVGNQYRITIINPVSYASYVEYGHRQTPGRYVPQIGKRLKSGWVKGKFMLTISEAELITEAPPLIEKKIMAFLRGVFDAK